MQCALARVHQGGMAGRHLVRNLSSSYIPPVDAPLGSGPWETCIVRTHGQVAPLRRRPALAHHHHALRTHHADSGPKPVLSHALNARPAASGHHSKPCWLRTLPAPHPFRPCACDGDGGGGAVAITSKTSTADAHGHHVFKPANSRPREIAARASIPPCGCAPSTSRSSLCVHAALAVVMRPITP